MLFRKISFLSLMALSLSLVSLSSAAQAHEGSHMAPGTAYGSLSGAETSVSAAIAARDWWSHVYTTRSGDLLRLSEDPTLAIASLESHPSVYPLQTMTTDIPCSASPHLSPALVETASRQFVGFEAEAFCERVDALVQFDGLWSRIFGGSPASVLPKPADPKFDFFDRAGSSKPYTALVNYTPGSSSNTVSAHVHYVAFSTSDSSGPGPQASLTDILEASTRFGWCDLPEDDSGISFSDDGSFDLYCEIYNPDNIAGSPDRLLIDAYSDAMETYLSYTLFWFEGNNGWRLS